MRQATGWVERPQHPVWAFYIPRPNLLKIAVDLRPIEPIIRSLDPQQREAGRPGFDLTSLLHQAQLARYPETGGQQPEGSVIPELFRKENQPPRSGNGKHFTPFGSSNSSESYFGGPIFQKALLKWRPTCPTRANGDVIGAQQLGIPLPFNIQRVMASVGAMRSSAKSQTMLWVGPRVCISTLHMYNWYSGANIPSKQECQLLIDTAQAFDVECEITSQILNEYSPKVCLRAFDIDNDIGIFTLLDVYTSITNYIDPEWLLERDEVYNLKDLNTGRKVGCIGYNSATGEEDTKMVKAEIARQLQTNLREQAFVLDQIDLDKVTRPGLKSLAPGTLDNAVAINNCVKLGVSCSLWKGSSGGPCFLLNEVGAGAIIGHVQGYDSFQDPFNQVLAFPVGLKKVLQNIQMY